MSTYLTFLNPGRNVDILGTNLYHIKTIHIALDTATLLQGHTCGLQGHTALFCFSSIALEGFWNNCTSKNHTEMCSMCLLYSHFGSRSGHFWPPGSQSFISCQHFCSHLWEYEITFASMIAICHIKAIWRDQGYIWHFQRYCGWWRYLVFYKSKQLVFGNNKNWSAFRFSVHIYFTSKSETWLNYIPITQKKQHR